MNIKHHFVREQVSNRSIKLQYCPMNDMVADILTKGLAQQQYSIVRERIVPQKSPTETELN